MKNLIKTLSQSFSGNTQPVPVTASNAPEPAPIPSLAPYADSSSAGDAWYPAPATERTSFTHKDIAQQGFLAASSQEGCMNGLNNELSLLYEKCRMELSHTVELKEEEALQLQIKLADNKEKKRFAEEDLATATTQLQGLATEQHEKLTLLEEERLEAKKQLVNARQEKTDQLREDIDRARQEGVAVEPLNKLLYYGGYSVLVGVTIYLFFFYMNVCHKVFFQTIDTSPGASTDDMLRQLTNGIFDPQAVFQLSYTTLVSFFFAFILFAIAFIMHFKLDGDFLIRGKKVHVTAVIPILVMAFAVDALLAAMIHYKMAQFQELAGLETNLWYKSHEFWVIMTVGFGTFFFWSLLFHSLMSYHRKRNPEILLQKQIAVLEGKVEEVKAHSEALVEELKKEYAEKKEGIITNYERKTAQLEQQQQEFMRQVRQLQLSIKQMEQRLNGQQRVVPLARVRACLAAYLSGWNNWLSKAGKAIEPAVQLLQNFITEKQLDRQYLDFRKANGEHTAFII